MGFVVDKTGVVEETTPTRSRPSVSGDIMNTLYAGDRVSITQVESDWCYVVRYGWCLLRYIKLDAEESKISGGYKESDQEKAKKDSANSRLKQQFKTLEESMAISSSLSNTDKKVADSVILNNLNGVYGIPYQFMQSVDPRIGDTEMGRKYSEKILSKMPLLCITPGTARFMSNYTEGEKRGIFNLLSSVGSNIETAVDEIINKNGRYFTFEFAYQQYFEYVNSLCRVGARFLNIEDVDLYIGGTTAKASRFDWQRALNSKLKSTFTSQEFIGFYIDSIDSVSESFSNSTGQSQLSNAVNGFSQLANEVGFLMGAGAGVQFNTMMKDEDTQNIMDALDDITKTYLKDGFIRNLGSNFSTVAVGGKLLFPEIWQDSEFSRDISVSIKLRTPDADKLSWYLNIYVPLCHLIALAAGHQTNTANGYYSPFLVRAFYKGAFNVDMGIITELSIRKGKEAAWNIDGLPTEIDIDITIKDLYNMLSIVSATEPKNFVTNNLLMDYVANTCGVNINQMDIQRSLEIYYVLATENVIRLPNRVLKQIQDGVDNYSMDLYNGLLSKLLI